MGTKNLRRRRYKLKADAQVTAVMRAAAGDLLKAKLREISSTGMSVLIAKDETDLGLSAGQIMAEGKLVWADKEWVFGRSVIKFVKPMEDYVVLGLMLIDAQAPVEGSLASQLEIGLPKELSKAELELESDNASLADFLGRDDSSRDIFSKAKKYHFYHSSLRKTGGWGYWLPRKEGKGVRIRMSPTRKDGRDDFIVMASNDYLGLSSRPEVVEAAKAAMDKYGFGATGSPVTTGQTTEHEALQEMLAKLFRTEDCLLFNSGYGANVGIISSLVGPADLVVSDILAHASIADGMQMSQGAKRFHKHNDPKHLQKVMERSRGEANGALVVVEGVFSMDGDVAPLKEIFEIARKYDARVMVDEAHSFGVIGKNCLGSADEAGLMGAVDLTMGTFSKICGTIGGFACGSKEVIDWLNVSARSVFFSVSLPPSTVAATLQSLKLFQNEPWLVGQLRDNIRFFADGLRKMGFPIAEDHRSAIVPVIIGDEEKLRRMYRILYDSGVYTIPVVYPAVSRTTSRFRFTVSTNHSISDLDYVLLVIRRAAESVGLDLGSLRANIQHSETA